MTQKKLEKIHEGKCEAVISVRVTPRSAKNEIFALLADGTVKIRLTSPPVQGKANTALIKLLSEILEVPGSKIEIVTSQTGHNKLVSISGMNYELIQTKLIKHLSP